MTSQYLNIEEKHRPTVIPALASLTDFTISEGEAVDAETVVRSPNVSLYCLDDATQRAIFVELPPDVDLALAPFVYVAQYEQALRLIAMPYDTFREVAHSLPEVQNLILIFSCGRSGSTLLSHVLNSRENVLSLSEPDVASQYLHLRRADGSRDVELSELLDCTVRMLFKPSAFKTPTIYALKFRSEVTQTMDLFHTTFPQAKNLYLYRDAVGFIASFYRLFKSMELPEISPLNETIAMFSQMANYDYGSIVSKYLGAEATQISMMEQFTLYWIAQMEWYLAQVARGIPVLAVRYADLNAQREQVLAAIFDYCGLPTEQVARTLSVFDRDSQAGTALAREKPSEGNALRLTNEQIAEITPILARHPIIKESDFIAPGTLHV